MRARAARATVRAVQVDLATAAGVERLYAGLGGRVPDAVALNAGIGAGGAFATDTELEQELEIVDLNVRSTVHLAKLVVRGMVARGEGRMLFTSSIASTMPGAFQAVYNASKSFVQSFALADMLDTKVGADDKDSPEDVARDGFEALMAGKERVVSHSLSTKAQGRGSRFIPDSVKAEMHRKMAEPGSARK